MSTKPHQVLCICNPFLLLLLIGTVCHPEFTKAQEGSLRCPKCRHYRVLQRATSDYCLSFQQHFHKHSFSLTDDAISGTVGFFSCLRVLSAIPGLRSNTIKSHSVTSVYLPPLSLGIGVIALVNAPACLPPTPLTLSVTGLRSMNLQTPCFEGNSVT